LVLGGGGYTVRNVARCWAYETGIVLDQQMPDEIPFNEYYEYYGPDFQLHITPGNMENLNNQRYLEKHKIALFEVLRQIQPAPSAPFREVPRDREMEEPEREPDVRVSQRDKDKQIQDPRDWYDGDKDQDKTIEATKTAAGGPIAMSPDDM